MGMEAEKPPACGTVVGQKTSRVGKKSKERSMDFFPSPF